MLKYINNTSIDRNRRMRYVFEDILLFEVPVFYTFLTINYASS